MKKAISWLLLVGLPIVFAQGCGGRDGRQATDPAVAPTDRVDATEPRAKAVPAGSAEGVVVRDDDPATSTSADRMVPRRPRPPRIGGDSPRPPSISGPGLVRESPPAGMEYSRASKPPRRDDPDVRPAGPTWFLVDEGNTCGLEPLQLSMEDLQCCNGVLCRGVCMRLEKDGPSFCTCAGKKDGCSAPEHCCPRGCRDGRCVDRRGVH